MCEYWGWNSSIFSITSSSHLPTFFTKLHVKRQCSKSAGPSLWQENLQVGDVLYRMELSRYSVGSKSCNILKQKDVAWLLRPLIRARNHTFGQYMSGIFCSMRHGLRIRDWSPSRDFSTSSRRKSYHTLDVILTMSFPLSFVFLIVWNSLHNTWLLLIKIAFLFKRCFFYLIFGNILYLAMEHN